MQEIIHSYMPGKKTLKTVTYQIYKKKLDILPNNQYQIKQNVLKLIIISIIKCYRSIIIAVKILNTDIYHHFCC